jgi:phosphoadenosine phosphosulfate reductase
MTMTDMTSLLEGPRLSEAHARNLSLGFAELSLPERLRAIGSAFEGRLVFTTSFGLEDQAITHAIAAAGVELRLVTLDTGRLYPETYDLWAATEDRYGLRIDAFSPERVAVERVVRRDGINGFRRSVEARKACCGARKIEPLERALGGAEGWITGLRAEQSAFRSATRFVMWDEAHALTKLAPLADWDRETVLRYVAGHDVP